MRNIKFVNFWESMVVFSRKKKKKRLVLRI